MKTWSELTNILKHDIETAKISYNKFKNDVRESINEFKNKETRKKQIPNALTASRLFAPFFIIPTALSGNLILTMIFVSSFALTDAFDGYFARKYNCTSEFGRELDPITDKLFASSLLVPLIVTNPVLIINFILEGVIAVINLHSRLNDNKPRTCYTGKVKTTTLSITMICSYINMLTNVPTNLINFLITSTSLLQVLTAKIYYDRYKKDEKEKEKEIKAIKSNKDINKNELVIDEKEKINEKTSPTIRANITIEQKIEMLKSLKSELVQEKSEEIPKQYKK